MQNLYPFSYRCLRPFMRLSAPHCSAPTYDLHELSCQWKGSFFRKAQALASVQLKVSARNMSCCGSGGCGDLSKEALKKRLTSMQYLVTQEKDTERPFSGKYCNHFEEGIYSCICCSQDLFSSRAKFESKCGWPAFYDVVDSKSVNFKNDLSLDMQRTEVTCSGCGAHLGHVFDDGPKPTGKRYCINSAALDFKKAETSVE